MYKVKCTHCGLTYNLESVKIIARYSDCTVFKTPCCNVMADDREWKILPDFKKVDNYIFNKNNEKED
jgi:hypothetical protein